MKNGLARKAMTAAAFLTLLPASGWAFPGDESGPRLPPEAYKACEGKKAGDQVEFRNRQGKTVKAVCTDFEGRLLALPPRDPAKGPGKRGEFRREGRMDADHRLERMAAVLDLTEEQQGKIRAAFAAEREKTAPLREKMAGNWEKVKEAIHSGTADEAAIRALAAEGAGLKGDLLVSRARTWKDIRAILTPAQQEKARQLAELRGREKGECRSR